MRSEFQHGFDDLKEALRDSQPELLLGILRIYEAADAKFKDRENADIIMRRHSDLEAGFPAADPDPAAPLGVL